eukprot:2734612-Pleurochrysis_carterae.AAC.1
MPVKGVLQPCDCCSFGSSPAPSAELAAFNANLDKLKSDRSDEGKKALAAFLIKYKRQHLSILPGPDGVPFTSAGFSAGWLTFFTRNLTCRS